MHVDAELRRIVQELAKTSLREFEEGSRPMRQTFALRRQSVFFFARHFAECARMAVRQKHRIVAKALVAPRRPDERAGDATFEFLHMTVGPGDAKRGDEMRCAALRRHSAGFSQLLFDFLHGFAKILVGPGPARRMDARRAVERIDHEAGIVGKGRQAGCLRRRFRLDARVVAECRSNFFGFGKSHVAR